MTALLKQMLNSRRAVLSVLLAALMVTAGCSSGLSGVTRGETPAEEQSTESQLTPTSGVDLRNISLSENMTIKKGELDGSDPRNGDTVYEPVQFAATAGTQVYINMESYDGEETVIRVRNPNGTVVDIASNGEDGEAEFEVLTLSETGRYTIEATSATPNTTFEYTLGIQKLSGNFVGPRSTWSKDEGYHLFAGDVATNADFAMENAETYNYTLNDSINTYNSPLIEANTTGDYAVLSYRMRTELNGTQFVGMDWALLSGFANMVEIYENDNDETWIPDRVYFRGVTYDGELYRTHYINTGWVREYLQDGDKSDYWWKFVATRMKGSAHSTYEPGGDYSTTDSEFPLGTYENFTVEENTPQS